MHREEVFAQVRRRLEVGEEVCEEVRGVREGRVLVFEFGVARAAGGVVFEDDDFVDAEDGEGAGYGAYEVGFLVVRFGAAKRC